MNLGEIFNYANDNLLEGNLDSISEIIRYLQKAQDIIERKAPVKAPVFTTILTASHFTLPENYRRLHEYGIYIDGNKFTGKTKIWPNADGTKEMYLPASVNSGSLEMYYYKKATPLNGNDLSQVPDVDERYHIAMAEFAAKMVKMVDDDSLKKDYENEFFASLAIFNGDEDVENTITRIAGIW